MTESGTDKNDSVNSQDETKNNIQLNTKSNGLNEAAKVSNRTDSASEPNIGDSKVTNKSKKDKIDEILLLKSKINVLISNIRDTKTLCEKYENENQYLQDYIGSLMNSDELK